MLGTLFFVAQQFLFQRQVFVLVGATRSGAGDGAQRDLVALQAHQNFGRSADHMEIFEVKEEHVGRRVERADGAVQRQRRGGERLAHALREHHLHHVAFDDVILGALHGSLEGLFTKARHLGLRLAAHVFRHRNRCAQFVDQFAQAALGATKRARHFRLGIHHQGELAGEVVDNRDLFGEQQQDVRRADRVVFFGAGQTRLDVTHRVVTEAADQAAGKTRQALVGRHLDALHELGHVIERIAIVATLDQAVAGEQQRAALVHFDTRVGRQADHRIATKALAALHRFEQVGVGLVGQLQVNGQRGVEIGKGLEGNRDTVIALRGKRIEFGF